MGTRHQPWDAGCHRPCRAAVSLGGQAGSVSLLYLPQRFLNDKRCSQSPQLTPPCCLIRLRTLSSISAKGCSSLAGVQSQLGNAQRCARTQNSTHVCTGTSALLPKGKIEMRVTAPACSGNSPRAFPLQLSLVITALMGKGRLCRERAGSGVQRLLLGCSGWWGAGSRAHTPVAASGPGDVRAASPSPTH